MCLYFLYILSSVFLNAHCMFCICSCFTYFFSYRESKTLQLHEYKLFYSFNRTERHLLLSKNTTKADARSSEVVVEYKENCRQRPNSLQLYILTLTFSFGLTFFFARLYH